MTQQYDDRNKGILFPEDRIQVMSGKLDFDGRETRILATEGDGSVRIYAEVATLGANRNPKGEKSPQFMGPVTINEVRKFVTAWKRTSQKNDRPFISMSALEPKEPEPGKQSRVANPFEGVIDL